MMKRRDYFRVCLSVLLLQAVFPVAAQTKAQGSGKDSPLRVEIRANSDEETYRVQPYDARGIVIFYKSVETVQDTSTNWYFSFYDKNLQQVWIRSVPIQSEFEFISSQSLNDTLIFLFQAKGKKKEGQVNLFVLRLSMNTLRFLANTSRIDPDAEISGFDVSGGKLVVGYERKNAPAHLFYFDLVHGNRWNAPMTGETASYLQQFRFDSSGNTVIVAFRNQVAKKYSEINLAEYDTTGKQLHQLVLSTVNSDRSFTAVRFIPSGDTGFMVAGTYALNGQSSAKGKQDVLENHHGFFTTSVTGWEQKAIRFYNFLNLNNASNLLTAKEMLLVKKKTAKKNSYPEEMAIGFNLLLYDLIKRGDQVILVAETFYPQYHTENYTEFDFYGRPYTNSQTVFDGYRYTHGILAGFNKNGIISWDNTMEINDLMTFRPEEKISLYFTGNDLVLCYVNEGKIAYKIVRGNEVIEKLDYVPLELLNAEDKVISESKSRIVYWYGNYFLCYGFQEIKNLSADRTGKRWVFFVNKIKFEE